MEGILEFLTANPVFLVPILLIGAMMVFAVLKRLLKLAAIQVIAGVLYTMLMEYMGTGT